MNNKISYMYIKYRVKHPEILLLFYVIMAASLTIAVIIGDKAIYLVVAIIWVVPIIEKLLIKCPACGKRAINSFKGLEKKCGHCKKDFTEL